MTTNMNVSTWGYSVKTEAERLIHCAHQIIVGFYKTNNFIVLPYNPNVLNTHIVTFPDLSYTKIGRFWEQSKQVDVNTLPIQVDPKLTNRVIEMMESSNLPKCQFEKIKKLWKKAEKEIINEIYKVIPSKKSAIKKIIIYPTSFGTSTSFNWIDKNGEIIIYLRDDQGIHAITEAIITSLARKDVYEKLEGIWQESEIITDYLITETSIAKVLQKYDGANTYIPTLKGIRVKEQVKLMQESNEFYKKLGIPSFEKPFGYNGLVPEFFGKPVANLTETEKKVLLNLIINSNTVTKIDDIGSTIFKSEDNFSLYAIAKTIQRLRDKLEDNGISGSYIQTLRGKGYMLKN